MTGIQGYATEVALNTELLPTDSLPGRVDDALRQVQADIAADYRDREWTEWGDGDGVGNGTANYSCTYVSASSFRITGGDFTAAYHTQRRLRATGALTGTIMGVIASASYDGVDTTVVATWDNSGVLQSEGGLRVWVSTLSADGNALPIAGINGRPIDMDGETLTDPLLTRYAERRVTLAIDSGAVEWDLEDGMVAYLRLTENVTSITITGWADSPNACSPVLYRQQDLTGGRTMTGWPAGVQWFGTEPPPTADAYAVDAIGLSTLDGGVSVMGSSNLGAIFTGHIG